MGFFGKLLDKRKKSKFNKEAMRSAQRLLEDKLSARGRAVKYEFDRLRFSNIPSCDEAAKKENIRRNRYCDVLPYDFNRVHLASGEYINASYLQSKESDAAQWRYIATQGPLKTGVEDFWQMVFEQESNVIIMLTRTTEKFTEKCASYFSEKARSEERHGVFLVRTTSQSELNGDVTSRELSLVHSKKGITRKVMHYHYHTWPDHGVPDYTDPIRVLSRLLRSTKIEGPPIVHCSAGIGRTGTFCTVDITLHRLLTLDQADQHAAEKAVDVKRVVMSLRKQRYGMVQNPQQYLFCHQAIKEEIDDMLDPGSHLRPVRQSPQPSQASFSENLHELMVSRASSSFEQL